MTQKTRVLIVDTDSLMRDGLIALLTTEECEIVAAVSGAGEALHQAELAQPDLVIMDLSVPSAAGPDTIAQLKRSRPQTRVLVLTFVKEERMINGALRAGADGYMLKSDTRLELIAAIRAITQGKGYISSSIHDRVIDGYLRTQGGGQRRRTPGSLSQRERQVVRLIAEGYRTREIAQQLSLSHKTIEKHRTNLMRKLGLKTATAVVAYAIANGYLEQ